MQRCHSLGHFVEDTDIILGKGSHTQICLSCVVRLKIPYTDPITKEKITFNKTSVLEGWTYGPKARNHMKGART